jgi:hypothetical protein
MYKEISDVYKTQNTNIFTVTGNINDINLDKVLIKNKLISDLEKNNHVIYFSPASGLRFTQDKFLKEFYDYDETLKEVHQKAFSLNYAHTKYDILSGLHMIKTLLASYRELREKYVVKNLVVIIDDSDIVFPNKPIDQMSNQEKLILSLAREILTNSEFSKSEDLVILLAQSFLTIDDGIRTINGLYSIKVDLPDYKKRLAFLKGVRNKAKIAEMSAGINLFTLDTLIKKGNILDNIHEEIARSIEKSLGSYVSILRPSYGFDAVIGYSKLKEKALTLIDRIDSKYPWRALAYIGATGTGKDFQTEAFLYEAGLPVIKLGTFKSKWYGETAIILEKIKMVARSFDKVIIYKPEADKLFPDPEASDSHQTDQEISGIFLDWLSDPGDKGKIFWVFNTSRPQMFPVDFQRRIEIKLPIFDIKDKDDKKTFIQKMFELKDISLIEDDLVALVDFTSDMSSDNIRMMAQEVAAVKDINSDVSVLDIVSDLNFDIVKDERDRQAREAARFSTYKSLLP